MNAATPQPERRGPQRMDDRWYHQLEINLGFTKPPVRIAQKATRARAKTATNA